MKCIFIILLNKVTKKKCFYFLELSVIHPLESITIALFMMCIRTSAFFGLSITGIKKEKLET